MTLTPEQLDELEAKAKAAETPGPWRWDSDGDALESVTGHARVLGAAPCGYENSYIYGNEGDKEHIAANSPDITLHLVAVYRAALAWNEARKAYVAAQEALEDDETLDEQDLLDRLRRAKDAYDVTPLVEALRGRP